MRTTSLGATGITVSRYCLGAMSEDPNRRGNSRRWIMTEVENSLRRLDTDWIDQLEDLLAGASVGLADVLLDRIDALVPPGTNVNAADAGWVQPAIAQAWRKRRPADRRSAA